MPLNELGSCLRLRSNRCVYWKFPLYVALLCVLSISRSTMIDADAV